MFLILIKSQNKVLISHYLPVPFLVKFKIMGLCDTTCHSAFRDRNHAICYNRAQKDSRPFPYFKLLHYNLKMKANNVPFSSSSGAVVPQK